MASRLREHRTRWTGPCCQALASRESQALHWRTAPVRDLAPEDERDASLAIVITAMQNAYMAKLAKTATVTVRIPESLKDSLEARALREHRSLSAQIEHELTQSVGIERTPGLAKGTLLGRFTGKKVPTDADVREARAMLWRRLERDR